MTKKSDQEEIRAKRRAAMIQAGIEAYPAKNDRTASNSEIAATWADGVEVVIVGRVIAKRQQGGASFIDLHDGRSKLQTLLQEKNVKDYSNLIENIDLGDFLEVSGKTFITKRGEKTVEARTVKWLAKTLRPLPSTWHGLEDVELRYRHRELDLIADEKTRDVFRQRAEIIKSIRTYLEKEKFIEVETPILQTIPGGANAKPFITKHQALNLNLYLRIAPELFLKRLMVGGLDRVYEIARCFRNEGIDHDHNPEFTQVEFYAAYQDYEWMMKVVEEIIIQAAKDANGQPAYRREKELVEISRPFPRLKYHDILLKYTAIDIDVIKDDKELIKLAQEKGADVNKKDSRVKVIDELFKTFVRPKIIDPTIIYDYPADLIPLAKKTPSDPNYVQCFQLLMGGTEIAKAFSEQNDPVVQREQFESQEKMRAGGDEEAQRIDEEYLQAMEYGMPPNAGCGIGIDRLVAVLTGRHSIKEVILFPTLKPKK